MPKIKKLSVIIPCYQERENARRFEQEVFQFFDSYPFEKEYLLVNDGSSDGTADILSQYKKQRSDIKIIDHDQNKGLGASIRSGLTQSTGDAVLTLDADLTFHPSQFPKLLNAYHDNIDCVLGSPLRGKMDGVPFYRRLLSHGVNLIYRILLGRKITSASSLFRIYRSSALNPEVYKSHDFQINAEILLHLIRKRKKTIEVGVDLTQRQWGESKINNLREIKNHLSLFLKIITSKLGLSGS